MAWLDEERFGCMFNTKRDFKGDNGLAACSIFFPKFHHCCVTCYEKGGIIWIYFMIHTRTASLEHGDNRFIDEWAARSYRTMKEREKRVYWD